VTALITTSEYSQGIPKYGRNPWSIKLLEAQVKTNDGRIEANRTVDKLNEDYQPNIEIDINSWIIFASLSIHT
jgi:hypothetical protein